MNKQTLFNVGLLIVIAILISFLFSGENNKLLLKEKEQRIEELEQGMQHIEQVNDSIEKYVLTLEDSVVAKEEKIKEQDSLIKETKRVSTRRIAVIETYTQTEADSLLAQKFPHEEARSRDILIELEVGEQNKQIVAQQGEKIVLLEKKGLDLEALITSKDLIINNLEKQLEMAEEISQEREEQLTLTRKEVKRQKRQKIGAVILGGIAVVLSLLAGN